jgi:hypothetical protein
MANTTFNGPVRSENGFQSITKNLASGEVTANYLNVKFDFTGMTHTAVTAGAAVTLAGGVVSTVNFTGAGAAAMNLPSAIAGTKLAYVQRVDTTGGTATLTFNANGTDAWYTGSLIETRAADNVSYDTSTAGEGQLVFTAANATTNFFTIGSILYFSCTEDGLWHVGLDSAKDPLAVKGAFAWAA